MGRLEAFALGSFNPRICKRCDSDGRIYSKDWKVSIHASVKDATAFDIDCALIARCFNPRICKRCDNKCLDIVGSKRQFQSTHL